MSIKTHCRKCRREYHVKEELAGKKFRCKDCQSPVVVPKPAVLIEDETELSDDDFFGSDDFGNFDEDFGNEDYSAPVRSKKKSAAKKKKRGKKRASAGAGIGTKIGRIVGAVFGVLVVLGFAVKVFTAVGGLGGLDLGVSWKSYTTPDGNVSVLMPGDVKPVPVAQLGPGGQSYGVSRRNYGCIIAIEPMPNELQGMSEEDVFQAFEFGSGFMGASNTARTTINGRNCLTFDRTAPNGVKSSNLAVMYKNKFYTLSYAFKGVKGSGDRKYFDSLKFN